MIAPPPRRSLTGWALLAVLVIIGSYVFTIILAIACVYLPFLLVTALLHITTVLLFLGGVATALGMLRSLAPRREKFAPPGPRLDPEQEPRLFAELQSTRTLSARYGVRSDLPVGEHGAPGNLKFVGDIDYCEYAAPGTYSTTGIVASASVHANRSACPLCERVKVLNPKWSQSCAAWDSTTSVELARLIDEGGAYQLKLDFITSTQAVGTAEATNMTLLLAAGREDEVVWASFAAQEAPILGSVLPRPLCDPLQLGRYINFLIEQVQHYADANPVKALKRALSLARILMLPQRDDDLIEHLQDPRAALTAAINARSQLLETLSGATEADSARAQTCEALRHSLESTIEEMETALGAKDGTQPATEAAVGVRAGEIALALSAFIQDAREAIAADRGA